MRRQYVAPAVFTYYKEPAGDEAATVHEEAKNRGLLFARGGAFGNVLRIKPPMCITRGDVDFLADCLDEVFASIE